MDKRIAVAAGVLALLIGFGVGAVAFSGSSSSKSGGSVGHKPIALPESLGGFKDIADAMAAKGASATILRKQRTHQATVRAQTIAQYGAAYGGAAVGYRQYADSGLEKLPYVIAIRASAPRLTTQSPAVDAAFLGLATPDREVKSVGSVDCLIQWSPPTVAGHTPPPSSERVFLCQRSTNGVTVLVGSGGFAGPADLQLMAGLVNDAWSAASA